MKSGSLIQDVVIAAALTAASIPLAFGFATFAPGGSALFLTVATLSFAFIVTLLQRQKLRTGKVTALIAVILVFTLGYFFYGTRAVCLLAALMIWSVRSLFSYSSFLMAGLDLLLTFASLNAAWYVHGQTNSFLLGVWTFFLMQGFARWIPEQVPKPSDERKFEPHDDRFDRAYASAEVALRRVIRAG